MLVVWFDVNERVIIPAVAFMDVENTTELEDV
jgi:hypothetical protein